MRTFKLTIAYDGTDFAGFQRQVGVRTVQQVMEDTLAEIEGAAVVLAGAGRTDAGVHALGQVVSVRLTSRIAPGDLLQALNAKLAAAGSGDLRVIAAEEQGETFNARFDARGKLYRYRIVNGAVISPFERRFAWHIARPLSLERMREASAALLGKHDFAAFRAGGGAPGSGIRTVTAARWSEAPAEPDGRLLAFEIAGSGFLKYMVRGIVGTLVEIGGGRREAGSIADLVRAGVRAEAGATAPPHGLYLVRVDYDAARPVSFS